MTIIFPDDVREIVDRIKADVQNALPESNPFLKNSYLAALIYGYAGQIADFYKQLERVLDEMFMDTAEGIYLERWGTYVGITRKPAAQSEGLVTFTGTVSSTIPSGTLLQSSDGNQYTTQAETTIASHVLSISITRSGNVATVTTASDHHWASGVSVTIAGATQPEYNGIFSITATEVDEFQYTVSGTPATPATGTITATASTASVDVKSVDFGIDVNADGGAIVKITNPIAGVNTNAIVQYEGLQGGTDLESDEDLRTRILFRYQNPVANFNVAAIITKATEVPGVTRVFVEEVTPALGEVTIYFVRDNDDGIIPTSSEVTDVKNKILEIKPANTSDSQVIVSAPTPVDVDFQFASLTPNTLTMKTAVINNLTQFFRESTEIGVDVPKIAYDSAIYSTVDTETGDSVTAFTLTAPTGTISIGTGELAILGDVTF